MTSANKLHFARPQPLSPNQTARSAVLGEDGRWYRKNAKGGLVLAKGVPISQCIYYWWFEYLKRSERYQNACAKGGKGMQKLYNDFGNIYEYKFWDWWKERGADLFGERRAAEIDDFISVEEAVGLKEDVERGDCVLLAIPTNMTRASIKRQVNSLIKELDVKAAYKSEAKYPVNRNKVDAESLSKCLAAYDMKLQGCTHVEIGGYFDYTKAKLEELSEDGRSRFIYTKDEDMMKRYLRKSKANTKAQNEATKKVTKRLEREKIEYVGELDTEDLIDIELGILTRKDDERRKLKNYLNVSASRMLKKAEANISAVEKGIFPIAH